MTFDRPDVHAVCVNVNNENLAYEDQMFPTYRQQEHNNSIHAKVHL